MKRFFASLAVVLGLVSCQTEPEGLGVNVGGEQDVNITVSLPEGTRANSALGAFDNIDMTQYDIRYIFQVFNAEGTEYKAKQVVCSDATTVSFPVRLIPNRNYNFVVWADLVKNNETENAHYTIGESLEDITLNAWAPMDETRDAYTGCQKAMFDGSAITVELTRPFAKMRVITTDMAELLGVEPTKANVAYKTAHYSSFNALAQQPENKNLDKTHDTFEIVSYGEVGTLFTDYFFATAQQEVVKFDMEVIDSNDASIVTRNFSTDIPVKRNYVTTIKGDILTMGDNITVEVKPDFTNNGNLEDAPYYQVAVSNGFELVKALYEGREIIILNNITVTAADVEAYLATTRAAAAINPVLNLNGFTITIENNNTEALVNLNGGALTVEGEGTIKSTAGALVEGTTVVTEGANVAEEAAVVNGVSAVKTGAKALAYVLANGGEFTFTENLTSAEPLLVTTANPIVINGADFTLTSAATRAIRIDSANANVVVNNLNIVVTTERVYPNDIRGISINPELSNVELTLNNCSVDFTHKTGNDWAYAVNVSGNGTGHKVTINGGTYNGANVVNVHGANNTIVVKNATLTSLYPNHDVYYGACIWVLQNQGSSVYAEGNTFNGNNAMAFNLGTGTTLEEKDNIDNTMFYYDGTCYVGSSEKFQKAIAEGANNIVLGKGTFDLPSSLVQKEGTLTIIGAGVEETILNGANNTNGNNPGNYTNGVALEFEGLTFKTAHNGYNGGFGHAVSVTFRESKIVGQFYAHSNAPHYFYNCTIDPLTGYLYTYGSDCVFEGCTFAASEGKALQIYEDAASGENTVTITNCAFVAAKQAITWDGKPVTGIDINSNGAKFEVYINNCTTTGFPTGLNSNSNLWNVKDAGKAHANVYVDGVQVWFAGFETVADGLLYNGKEYVVISAKGLVALSAKTIKGGETVKLGADIDLTGVEFNGLSAFNSENNNTFDGKNYTVSNWKYEGGASDMGFIRSWVGTIKNVNFENCHLKTAGRSAIVAANTYTTIENVKVNNCSIVDSYWACGIIAGLYNAGSVSNCTVTNSSVKSNGGTAAIVGVFNESAGERGLKNCSVSNTTINNTGVYGEAYSGGALVGMFNCGATFTIEDCTVSNNTLEGGYVYVKYPADESVTIIEK